MRYLPTDSYGTDESLEMDPFETEPELGVSLMTRIKLQWMTIPRFVRILLIFEILLFSGMITRIVTDHIVTIIMTNINRNMRVSLMIRIRLCWRMIPRLVRYFFILQIIVFSGMATKIATEYITTIIITNINRNIRYQCQTETCIQEAATMIGRMNKSIDPCDDFYEFACGRFIKETLVPEDKSLIYPAGGIEDLVELQLQNMISEPSLPTDIEPYVMLRKMYAACMDTNAIEKSGLNQMKLLLKKLGSWPILESCSWLEIDWINITENLRQYGFETNQFIGIDAEIDLNGSTEYVIHIHQWKHDEMGSMISSQSYGAFGKKYSDFLVKIAELFGAIKGFAKREVEAVIKFRERLANALETVAETRRMWNNTTITTVEKIQLEYPTIPWLKVINVALQLPNTTLSKQTRVAVTTPRYIAKFAKIVKETPKRVLANHALFQIIRSRINCLPTIIWEAEEQLLSYMTNIQPMRPVRWRTCVKMVTDHFGIAIDALYIRKYRNDNAKEEITEMASNVKNVFTSRLRKITWMDNKAKFRAVKKASLISANVAYPEELRQEQNIADCYKGLIFGRNKNILALVTQMSKFNKDKQLSLYSNPVVKNHWTSQLPAITSKAFYDVYENNIHIPVGVMQNEFYRFGGPMYKNYGGLGFVLAHEILLGFDSQDWLNTGVKDQYDSKDEWIVDLYIKYTVVPETLIVHDDTKLPGIVADKSGVTDAYLAYVAWRKGRKPELPLPGLNLTNKQLFWVSYANSWCAKHEQKSLKKMVLRGINPPFRFKILDSLRNNEYFSKDFNCSLGSNMNPIKSYNDIPVYEM